MRRFLLLTVFLILSLQPQVWASRSKVKKLAKKTKISLKLLQDYKARRFFARDVYQRREFIKAIADKPDHRLLPLVALIGTKETADEPIRRSSIRLYSHLGLLADRTEVKSHIFPAIKKALSYGSKRGQDQRWSMEELITMSKWFELDADLFELLKPIFEGDDFNLRSCAFQAMLNIRHKKITADYLIPACLKIYHATKGYSMGDRQRAVRYLQQHAIEEIGPLLRDDMLRGSIPKLQILSMDVFAQWGDKSALPVVHKIGFTAVHQLRRGAFKVMAALKDPSCLEHLDKRFGSDHILMLTSSVEELWRLGDNAKALKVLTAIFTNKYYPAARVTLWQRKSKPETIGEEKLALKIAAAMALLKLGNSQAVTWLQAAIKGDLKDFNEDSRNRLCSRVLGVRNAVTSPLIAEILKLRADKFRANIKRAVIVAGERKIKDCEANLIALHKDEKFKGHIQFHCAVSLHELSNDKIYNNLITFMKDYNDNIVRKDKTKFVLGKLQFDVNRWIGSEYITALNKFDRTRDQRMLPLILEMLKPIPDASKKTKKGGKKVKKRKKTSRDPNSTRVRKSGNAKIWLPSGPEPRYRVRNQFVRARAVLVAARIGKEQAFEILNKAVIDHRAIVRSAAIRAIGELSGQYVLHVGATSQEEANLREEALDWLSDVTKKYREKAEKLAKENAKKAAAEKEKAKTDEAKKTPEKPKKEGTVTKPSEGKKPDPKKPNTP